MSGSRPSPRIISSLKRAFCVFAVLNAAVQFYAQESGQPLRVVRMESFKGSALPLEELRTLESMIASYVMELKAFRVIDPEGTERSLRELETAMQSGDSEKEIRMLSADFILSGNVGRIGDAYVMTLDNTKVTTGEKLTVSERCDSVNDIVLKARSLTQKLFGKETGNPKDDVLPEIRAVKSISEILGIWKGDKGLDSVRILRPDGTAIGVLTGGTSMRLSVSVEGGVVIVRQAEPNRPEFFMSATLPYSRAKLISDRARQVSWIFSLSADGKTLSGKKQSVLASGDHTGAITVDNSYVREAAWIRSQ